jgi:hypothetical protein
MRTTALVAIALSLAGAMAHGSEAAQRALEVEIDSRVHASCLILEQSNPVAVYTNELCVRSFKTNGLPE